MAKISISIGKKGATSTNPGGSTSTKSSSSSSSSSKSSSSSGSSSSSKATTTTYTDPSGKTQTGYIIDGKTYKDSQGKTRIDNGSLVTIGNTTYRMTDSGGVLVESGKVAQTTPQAANQITYKGSDGKDYTGYIVGNKTYKDAEGKERIEAGSIVTTGGQKYLLGADGKGLPISDDRRAWVYEMDEYGQIDTNSRKREVYNVNGINYDAKTGQKLKDVAGDNEVVINTNGKYYLAKTGEEVNASEVTDEMPTVSKDQYVSDWAQIIYDAINQEIALDPTLSWEEAFARAYENLNPQYNQAYNKALDGITTSALQSGFFGQLPTEALRAQTAGALEADKLQAINELAAQLFGQSEESAYNKLNSATQSQQNKIANLLSMLGIYQSERAYGDSRDDAEWEKQMAEAGLTGMYNGQPTVDYLKATTKSTGSGSGSTSSSYKPKITAAQAKSSIENAIKNATTDKLDEYGNVIGQNYSAPHITQEIIDAYNYYFGTDYDITDQNTLIRNENGFDKAKVEKIVSGLGSYSNSQSDRTTIVNYLKDLYQREALSKREANYILEQFGLSTI